MPLRSLSIHVRNAAILSIGLGVAATGARADLVISANPTSNVVCSAGVCTATKKGAVLNVSDLQNLLATSNTKVTTGTEPVDIKITAPLTWISAKTLTLDAYHSVVINKPVTVSGAGGLVLIMNDGGTGGTDSFGTKGNITFWSLSSNLSINGANYTLVGDIATLASDIASNPGENYALANSYDASVDGTYSNTPIVTTFTGQFDGLGNTISKITVSGGQAGFLYDLGTGGMLRNLGITKANLHDNGPMGGLVYSSTGIVMRCYVTGRMVGDKHSAVGGLVDDNFGAIDDSYTSVSITIKTEGFEVGGLVGYNAGTISNSYATGAVSAGNGGNAVVGGFVGANAGTISNSYAMGAVQTGQAGEIGGFAGANGGIISDSYSTGAAQGVSSNGTGGFIGASITGATVADGYWDITTSGTATGVGSGSSTGITGLTTAQLQAGLPAGFDPAIWSESPSINGGLPYLLDIPPP